MRNENHSRVHGKRKLKKLSEVVFDIIVYGSICLFILFTALPIFNVLVLSFNNGEDAKSGGVFLWPRKFTLDNYIAVVNNQEFLVAGRNTVLRTVLGTVLALFFIALFAYALSKPHLMFRKIYIVIGAITMYFNGGLIPYYLLILKLNLFDNFLVYIIPTLFNMGYTLILVSFFKTIPSALIESAKIDGAGEFHIFFRIVAPVSVAVFVTIALFLAVGHWNTWFDTLLYTRNKNLITLPFLFMRMIQSTNYLEEAIRNTNDIHQAQQLQKLLTVSSQSLQYACMMAALFPIAVTYPFLQKYFIKGIMIGSIKA